MVNTNSRCQLCNGVAIKVDEHWYLCTECNQRSYQSGK
jgi:hypothetical protein